MRMLQRARTGIMLFIFGLLALAPVAAMAQEAPATIFEKLGITATGSIDFYSDYIWRGFTLDEDAVVQPAVSLSVRGFTFTYWSSWDANNDDGLDSDEMDYVFDYTKAFDKLSVSAGHIYYDFPGTNGYSREFYVGLGYSEIPFLNWPITLSVKYYRDYGDEENGGGLGSYTELAFAYSTKIMEDPSITLDLGVATGFNHELFIAGDGGQATLKAGLSIPLTKSLTAKPNINYTIPHGDLSDATDGNQDDVFWGGVSLVYVF